MIGKSIENYYIEEILGQGGMGSVYRALDTSLDRVVALKIMNPGVATNADFLRRFKSEARVLGRLQHPHIVNVYTFRHVDSHLIIVMEYVGGGTLSDLIEMQGPIPITKSLTLLKQALSALEFAHSSNVIHRDIKPPNILLTKQHFVKVSDFGLAKIQEDSNATMVTRVGMTGGTLHYMPPEQTEALSNVDSRGDLYSLGMTFYQMLAGRVPFDKNSSAFSILRTIDQQKIPHPSVFNPAIPADLVEIVMKSIKKYPEDRYQHASELREAIEQFEAGRLLYNHDEKTQIVSRAPEFEPTVNLHYDPDLVFNNRPSKTGRSGARSSSGHKMAGSKASRSRSSSSSSGRVSNLRPPVKRSGPRGKVLVPLLAVALITAIILIGPKLMPDRSSNEGNATPETSAPANAQQARENVASEGENESRPSGRQTPPARRSNTPQESAANPAVPSDSSGAAADSSGLLAADTLAGENPDLAQMASRREVTIRSNPAGATIFFNGTRQGLTPTTISGVLPEPQNVELLLKGYRTVNRTLNVKGDTVLIVDLVPLTGQIRVVVRPFGDIFVQGSLKARQSSGTYEESLPVGTYTIRAEHSSFGEWEKEVTIDEGDVEEIFFNFNEQYTITVASQPPNAEIIIDGQRIMNENGIPMTTPRIVSLRPGNHTITVAKEGLKVVDGPVEILLENNISTPFLFELEGQ